MADVNDVNFAAEQTPEVDWDAPESGSSFPPPAAPGTYEFIFHLPEQGEQQFTKMETKDSAGRVTGTFTQVNFDAELLSNGDGVPVPAVEGNQPVARFQRASFFKSDKMKISQGAELIRSLGLVDEVKSLTGGSLTPTVVREVLRQADGRARGKAEFIWRAYFKDTQTTVSTIPRKGKGKRPDELPWPRKADGTLEDMAQDPVTHAKSYGRLEINRYKLHV